MRGEGEHHSPSPSSIIIPMSDNNEMYCPGINSRMTSLPLSVRGQPSSLKHAKRRRPNGVCALRVSGSGLFYDQILYIEALNRTQDIFELFSGTCPLYRDRISRPSLQRFRARSRDAYPGNSEYSQGPACPHHRNIPSDTLPQPHPTGNRPYRG